MPNSHMFEKDFEPTSLADMPPFPHVPMPKRPEGGKCKAKVTRHVLPTLLGSAKNESLAVNVYEYRLGFGKGPLVRRITAGHVGQEEHDYSKAFISDGVAWGGAVHVSLRPSSSRFGHLLTGYLNDSQVIGSLVMPPFAGHHGHNDHGDHGHHGHDGHGHPGHGHHGPGHGDDALAATVKYFEKLAV